MLVNDFHHFQAPDNSPVQFLWVVPIYEDEASYAEDYGPRELANLFGANQLSLTDLHRPSANTSMSPEEVQQFLNPDPSRNAPKPDYVKKPSEISIEQIAAFRESNEVIINVSQKYKPRSKAQSQPRPQPAPQVDILQPESVESPPSPTKNKEEIRFDLKTGEQVAPSPPVSLCKLKTKKEDPRMICRPKSFLPKKQNDNG